MQTHGNFNDFCNSKISTDKKQKRVGGDKCFTNFAKKPDAGSTFTPGANIDDDLKKTASYISSSDRNTVFVPSQKKPQSWENPNIPSGYTYLLQLVAHDTVQTSLSSARNADECDTFHNHRTTRLGLDTLYGPHPRLARMAYAPGKHGDHFRGRLSLGKMQLSKHGKREIGDLKKLPLRDIGRMGHASGDFGLTEPCLADTRNDSTPILSQLITVFAHLHNGIMDRLETVNPHVRGTDMMKWSEDNFHRARSVVTLIYLNIIENDLLERLVQPHIYRHYKGKRVGFLHKNTKQIPLEFSHAAFRFGHAMIRPHYLMGKRFSVPEDLSSVLRFNSAEMPIQMPINERWVIDWSDFFDVGMSDPRNLSGRITPNYSGNIKPANRIERTEASLAKKDLCRSVQSNVWSVTALTELIKKKKPFLFKESNIYRDSKLYHVKNGQKIELKNWFQQKGSHFDSISKSFIEEPPLLFYILFEAECENKGIRLGTIGSILISDILFSIIKERKSEVNIDSTKKDINDLFGVDSIDSMPDLLRYVSPIMAPHSLFII